MKSLLLLSIALLCSELATAFGPLKCDQWQCSPVMQDEVQPGQRHVYSYSTILSTIIPGRKAPIVLDIKTTATIDYYQCRRKLTLSGTQMSSQDIKLSGDAKTFSALVGAIEQHPVYFRSNDGVIDGLCSKDPVWVKNFKRGLLSIFQQPRSPFVGVNRKANFEMIDIHGRCPTSSHRGDRFIRTTRNLASCQGRHRSFGGITSEPYSVKSPVQNPGLGSTQRCAYEFETNRRVVLKFAECIEELVFKAPAGDSAMPKGSANVNQKLVLLRSEAFKCSSDCRNQDSLSSFRSSGLEMQLEEANVPGYDGKEMSKLLCALAGPIRPENPAMFTRLVELLRTVKSYDWRMVVTDRPKDLCNKARDTKVVRAVLFEALAEAGDNRAVVFLTNRKMPNFAEKDRLLAHLTFARQPASLIKSLKPIFDDFERLPQSSLAAAALVHRFCSAQGGVCGDHKDVRPLLRPLERALAMPCHKMAPRKAAQLFRVLGNMPVPQRMNRFLTSCAQQSKAPMALRVAAIQSLRRADCPMERKPLLNILESPNDSELRIAAYHAVLRCHDPKLVRELRRILPRIRAAHVASYIVSHIANIRKNSDPDQAPLRHFLHDLDSVLPHPQDGLSRHMQRSFYSVGSNLGVRAEGSLVWSEKSAAPRSASARLTGQLFGRAVPFLELYGRSENLHEKMVRRRMTTAQYLATKSPQATAQLGLRLLGHEMLHKNFQITRPYLRPWRVLKDIIPANFRRNYLFSDYSIAFASGAGIPLRLRFRAATSAALTTTKRSSEQKSRWEAEFGLKPELAVQAEMSAAFELPGMRFGGQATGTAHTATEMRVKLELKNRVFKLSLIAPERQDILNIRWAVSSLHLTQTTPVAPMPSAPAFRWTSSPKLGYRYSVIVQNSLMSSRPPINNEISIAAVRKDSHTAYVLSAWDTKTTDREVGILMEMQGSKQRKPLKGVLKVEKKALRLDLSSPDGRKVEAAIGSEKIRGRGEERYFLTVKTNRGHLVDASWTYKRVSSKVDQYVVQTKVGSVSFGRLLVRETRAGKVGMLYARLDDFFRSPVQLHASLRKSEPNRWSIGTLQEAAFNLTSSFLLCDLNSRVDVSDRKLSAFTQVGYELPGRPNSKGSASVKLGWTRLSDKAFRDKFTFKSHSSQLPMLNTDLTLKSSIAAASDFRHLLVAKLGPSQVPLTASVRFQLDNKGPVTQSLIFKTTYQLKKVVKGEVSLMCERNRRLISFVTKVMHSQRGRSVIASSFSVKLKDREDFKALLSYSSELTPFDFETELRRPASGGLNFRFTLRPDINVTLVAKPFYQAVVVSASNAGWSGKASMNHENMEVTFSLSENSRYQIELRGANRYQPGNMRFTQKMTGRSGQIYDASITLNTKPGRVIGSVNMAIGPEESRQRLKLSFEQDLVKKLHNSNLELLIGVGSASLRNDYSYELSPRLQKLDGRSHVTSTFGPKRKVMLQMNLNNLAEQFNSDVQFSSSVNDKPSFMNLKINVKDKNIYSYAWKVALDSSCPRMKSVEVDYRHEIRRDSLEVETSARFLKKTYKLSFNGKKKSRRNYSGRMGVDFGSRSFGANLAVNPSGTSGALSVMAGKTAFERATWSLNRLDGSAQIRLRLPSRDTEFDLDYRARRLSVRLTKTSDGVERWGSELKLSLVQPSFKFELRQDGNRPLVFEVVRDGGLWKTKFDIVAKGIVGYTKLDVGSGYLGHRFYLSFSVFGASPDAPLAVLDIKDKPNRFQIIGNFENSISMRNPKQDFPCRINFDLKYKDLYQTNPVQLDSNIEIGPVVFKTVYSDKNTDIVFESEKGPVRISLKRDLERMVLNMDGLSYGLTLNAESGKADTYVQNLKFVCPMGDVLSIKLLQVATNDEDPISMTFAESWIFAYLFFPPSSFSRQKVQLTSAVRASFGNMKFSYEVDTMPSISGKLALEGEIMGRQFTGTVIKKSGEDKTRLTIDADLIGSGELARLITATFSAAPPVGPRMDLQLRTPWYDVDTTLSRQSQSLRVKSRDAWKGLASSLGLKSRFSDRWSVDFNVKFATPEQRRCRYVGLQRRCARKPSMSYSTVGNFWIRDGRYGELNCTTHMKNRFMSQRVTENFMIDERMVSRRISRTNILSYGTEIVYLETYQISYSEAGQVTGIKHSMESSKSVGKQKTVMFAENFIFNTSNVQLDMYGSALEKFLEKDPNGKKVLALSVNLNPSPQLRFKTGLTQRVAGFPLRFDLTGDGYPSKCSFHLKTSRSGAPWLNCSLQFSNQGGEQALTFRHERTPKKGAKVNLLVTLTRSPKEAEQRIELSRGGKQVLATSYLRKGTDVSVSLTMLGEKHFEAAVLRVMRGYAVTARSVSMLQPGAEQPKVVLEILNPEPGSRRIVLRKGEATIAAASMKETPKGYEAALSLGDAVDLSSVLILRAPTTDFTIKMRGIVGFDARFSKGPVTTFLVTTASTNAQIVSATYQGKQLSMGFASVANFKVNARGLQASWRGEKIARFQLDRPTANTVVTAMVWRPQKLRLAVNEAAEALDASLMAFCEGGAARASERLLRVFSPMPFGDASVSFRKFGEVMQSPRLFRSADFFVRLVSKRISSYVRVAARSVGCVPRAKDAILRLRPGLYGFADRLTTMQTWPDKAAERLGRLINGVATVILQRAISAVEEMEVTRPQLRQLLPSAGTLRFAQQQLNSRLRGLKAMTMLQGMQHLDSRLHTALKKGAAKLLKAAEGLDLQRDIDNAMSAAQPYLRRFGPEAMRRRMVVVLSATIRRLKDSKLAVNFVRSLEHDLNEFVRSALGVAVPRVEQINWRHGRVRVLWHLPLRLTAPPPLFVLLPPVIHRVYPGYFLPSEAVYDGFVQTFDQRIMALPCDNLVLARFRHPKLGWELTKDGYKVKLQLGKTRFVFSNGVSQLGSGPSERVIIGSKQGRNTLLAQKHGFYLEVGPRASFVKLRLNSPIYFGRMEGLFGNNDGLRNNDMAVPGDPFNTWRSRFRRFICKK